MSRWVVPIEKGEVTCGSFFQNFRLITRDGAMKTYRAGPGQGPFAVERRTPTGKELNILLSGKLAVK